MARWLLHFKSNESIMVEANDTVHAQEVAIEAFESCGIAHSEVMAIIRTLEPVTPRFIGMNAEGFTCYYPVVL